MMLHTREVIVRSAPRRIAGGEVVSVAWTTDDEAMRLSDGTIHPAHRAGWHWEEPVCNLRPIYDVRRGTLAAIRAHAVNGITRAVARDGITLTFAEADELGESTLAWMRTRLGLRVEETDRGVVCTSGYQSTETAGDRQEV